MRKKRVVCAAIALVFLLTGLLGGCGRNTPGPAPTEPAATVKPAATAEPTPPAETAEPTVTPEPTAPPATPEPTAAPEPTAPPVTPEPEPGTGRQDGERWEAVILLEGMEETVRYEHVRNDRIGFEMDYDYESFDRRSGMDSEAFVSCYDLPEHPDNYLEVRYSPLDADSAAEAVCAALSQTYELIRESYSLERAGSCIYIEASEGKGHTGMPYLLQAVYIIPAQDGCRIAAAHFTIESAEGFGRRFAYMLQTFSVLPFRGEKKLSEEQALYAVRRYCCIGNPELETMADDGEHTVYWEAVSASEEELVVLFRSYTGAELRYYIDRSSGETYVTESVPGVTSGEERTEESLNVWDYLF